MYTVEFDMDEVAITILDDTGNHGDLKVLAYDDLVYICQEDEESDIPNILEINPQMWEELINAIHSPEGSFVTVRRSER